MEFRCRTVIVRWPIQGVSTRGSLLTGHEVVVGLFTVTTIRSVLAVHAPSRDPGIVSKGVKVTDAEFATVPREPHRFYGKWNYTIGGKRLAA